MPDDAPFLAAITSAPADRLLKLVYADHLDECGDSRGELVRVEDRLRDVPAFADEFWTLKARRNQLRAAAPPDWLAAMRYGIDVYPVFAHGWPDGWRGRWRLIREFAERWHGVPMGDVGGRRDEVAEVEARIGRELPASVREFVAFAHDTNWVSRAAAGRSWVLDDMPNQGLFCLYDPMPAEWYDVIRHEDFHIDDPCIYNRRQVDNDWTFRTSGVPLTESVFTTLFLGMPSVSRKFCGTAEEIGPAAAELRRRFTITVSIGETMFYERLNAIAASEQMESASIVCWLAWAEPHMPADLQELRGALQEWHIYPTSA